MAATERSGSGRSAEFSDNGGGGGSGAILVKVDSVKTDGVFATTNLTYTPVPGTLISFTLTETKIVYFSAFGSAEENSGGVGETTLFGIRVDATDYPGTIAYSLGGERHGVMSDRAISLSAGAHTAEVVIKHAGGAGGARLISSADLPTVLTALYNAPVVAVGALTKVDATADGGGSFSTGSATFVVVTGTTINFSLTQARTVLFSGYGSAIFDGGFVAGTVLGVRIDGVDYPGSFDSSAGFGQAVTSTVVASKSIDLAAGAHTASLVVRALGASTAGVRTNTDTPAYLSAIYTETASPSVDSGILVSASFTGGNYGVPAGPMADVPDGAGFVEVVYVVTAAGLHYLDVDFVASITNTFPSDSGMDVGCSVNTVDQGFAYPGPYLYVVTSTGAMRTPCHYRMPLTLGLGVNTIRLRANATGGIPSATIVKVAASPVVVALMKG